MPISTRDDGLVYVVQLFVALGTEANSRAKVVVSRYIIGCIFEDGGDPYSLENLIVLTREEHREEHRREYEVPGESAWRELLRDLL